MAANGDHSGQAAPAAHGTKSDGGASANRKLRRGLILGGAVLAGNAALAGRLWQLQVVDTDTYQEQATRNRLRTEPVRPVRGLVFDRSREPLVRNVPVFGVWVTPADVPKAREGSIIASVAALTGERPDDVRLKLAQARYDPGRPVQVATDVERDSALAIEERRHDLPGVQVRSGIRRDYLHGDAFGHMLGFVGPVPAEALEEYQALGVGFDETVGLAGLERRFQGALRGTDGSRKVEIDALGRELNEIAAEAPVEGRHLVMTVAVREQRAIREILARHLALRDSGAGVAVVIRPEDGSVVALASLPDYDNNAFGADGDASVLTRLVTDPRRPLINHAVAGLYPPGSSYKVVAASAALETGIVLPQTKIRCDGQLVLPSGWAFKDWLATGHGMVDLHRGISESCNIYFYSISGGNPYTNLTGFGNRRMVEYERGFGFGEVSGIDLPGEAAGLVPTAEWKQGNLGQPWVTGDTYHAAIGQGLVQVTPLQIAMMYAALGNGGRLLRPRLVDRIVDSQGHVLQRIPVSERGRLPVSDEHLQLLRNALLEAVNGVNGTGKHARSEFTVVAGKTGTAEYSGTRDANDKLPSHAWFAGYAPAENPEYAFAVLVRDGGEGAFAAAPIARDIIDYLMTGQMPPLPQDRPDFIPPTRRLA